MFDIDKFMRDPKAAKLDKHSLELSAALIEALQKQQNAPAPMSFEQYIQKAQPTLNDVHVSTELTNLSIAYIQQRNQFLAGGTGIFGVANQSGFYTEYDIGDWFRISVDDALRTVGMESSGGGFKVLQTSSYLAKTYSYHKDVDEFLMAQQTVGDPVDDAMVFTLQLMMLLREQVFATNIMTTGWAVDRTGVSAGPTGDQFLQWNDASAVPRSDLSADCALIHSQTGMWPNVLTVQPFVLSELLLNAEVTEAFKYTTAGATPSLDALAASLMVGAVTGAATPRIAIAGAVLNTAEEGATDAIDYIVGKEALLAYVDPNPGIRTPTAWINFAWTGLLGANAFGFRMKDLSDEFKGIPHRIEADASFDIKRVAPGLGIHYATAVA